MMKILSKREVYLSNIEKYDLTDTFSESISNKGLVICFVLAVCVDVQFISLELEAEHEEVGVPKRWYKKYTKELFDATFTSLERFLKAYDSDDFGRWTFTFIYQNVEIVASGVRSETKIGTFYSKTSKVNLLPLLSDVETCTYEYNNYNKELMKALKDSFGMTEKRAVITVKKLQTHEDIFNEFVSVFFSGQYADASNAIKVEGITAEKLNSDYPLSVLGAYNYLIYLRESPKEALEDLRKGLPRK